MLVNPTQIKEKQKSDLVHVSFQKRLMMLYFYAKNKKSERTSHLSVFHIKWQVLNLASLVGK